MNILVVGYGVVGKLECDIIKKLNPDIYDKYKPEVSNKRDIVYDIAIISVPTPKTEISDCDVSEVINAIHETNAKIYVVKSTVLPGTCDELAIETGKRIVFSPEHAGGTQHCNNFEYDFTILGGSKLDCEEVIQMYQHVFDARHLFKITDRRTAELSKYMLNSYLAMKVSFCNQFAEIAKSAGVCYEELRELFILDPRINPAHTFVYRDAPYWDSHCFNKDVPAIANYYDAKLLKAVVNYNDDSKARFKK